MSKELKPEDFSRMMHHKPKDIKIPCAVLFKMSSCGWCTKMEPEWDEVAEHVGFMDVCHFCTDKNSDNELHWTKIENSLETDIDGFPSVMFYSPDGKVILHTGYAESDEMINKMIDFCS